MKNSKLSTTAVLYCFVLSIVMIFLTAMPALAGLEEKLPADTLFYVGWSGRSLTFDGSQFGQMLQQSSMLQTYRAIFRQAFADGVGRGQAKQKAADKIFELVDIAWQRPVAIGLAGLSPKTGVGRADLLIDLGKDKAKFEKLFNEAFAGLAGKEEAPPAISLGNGSYILIPDTEEKLACGFSENIFFITFGQAKAQAEALLTGKTGPGLNTNKKFVDCLKAVGGPDVQLAIYVDTANILKKVDKMIARQMPPQPTTQPAGQAAVSMVQKITKALGVEKLSAVAGTIRIVDKGMYSKLRLFSPAPHRGILMPFAGAPISETDLTTIPADADFALAINLDPAKLLAEIRRIAGDINPQAAGMMNGILQMAGAPVGISIEQDIINALGDTWMITSAESQGGLLTGTIISAEIKDPTTFAQTLVKIQATASQMLAGPATQPAGQFGRGAAGPALEKMTAGDVEINYLRSPQAKVGMAFLPAWAIHKNRIYLALWPQVLAAMLENKTPALTSTADFKKLRSRISPKASMISYINSPKIAKTIYPFQLVIGTIMSNAMQKMSGSNAPLPLSPGTIQDVLKLLRLEAGAASSDAGGITFEGFGSGPSVTTAVPVVAGGVAVLLPSLHRARGVAKKTMSMTNLRGMGSAMALYGAENYDKSPEHLGLLVENGTLGCSQFVSPVSGKKPPRFDKKTKKLIGPIDYVYISYADQPEQPGKVLRVYERPENYHGRGTNVLFCDGHVEWVDMPKFRKLHQEALKAGGKEIHK